MNSLRQTMTPLSVSPRSIITRKYTEGMWCGLSSEQASRVGEQLVRAAVDTGCWKFLPEHLIALRSHLTVERGD